MSQYADLVSRRNVPVDGIESWTWVTTDHGAFTGPKEDWEESHKAIYQRYVRNWDVVVQAGGNCGMYPALFARMFKLVYTFEPDPLNFFALVHNCQQDNIIKMQAALGDVHRMVEVERRSMTNVGMHVVHAQEKAAIPQLRIDDLTLPACDLIQLDIEGYEIHALIGAQQTIARFHPVIACENGNSMIANFLMPYGYNQVAHSKMDTIYA